MLTSLVKCAFTRRLGFVRKIVHALCFMDAVTDGLSTNTYIRLERKIW